MDVLPWCAVEGSSCCLDFGSDEKIGMINDFLDVLLETVIIFAEIKVISVTHDMQELCEWNTNCLAVEREQ